MRNIWIVAKRELDGYFATPVAYVFIVIFLLLSGMLTFYFGNFFTRGQADLLPFFSFHPWIYMVFMPAITMRLWAEERKTGTIELLLTFPITCLQAVIGKFLAAWIFSTVALLLTFPFWIIVNYLGNPDNGVIIAGYLGSILMGGGFLAVGACISAITKNQVVAFVLSLLTCLLLNLCGFPMVTEFLQLWLPPLMVETISSFSFLTNFEAIIKGLLDIKSLVYFVTLISFCVYSNAIFVELKKAD